MSNSELIESLFASFFEYLSAECTATRLPYSFLKAVSAARSAPDHNTPRIFLDAGFQAWVAYFVVKPGTANVSGQSARRQKFTALDILSVKERANLAKRVNDVPAHPTVTNRVQSMERMARQSEQSVPSKRRRRYPAREHRDGALTAKPGTEDHCVEPEELVSPPYTSDSPQNDIRLYHGVSQATLNSTSPQEITSGADIDELDLFPEYLRGAIRRDDAGDRRTAAVSMNFPYNIIADVDCAMTMEVMPNKVERLALLMFNAHLETNGKVREIILPGGLKVIPTRLQGSPPESVITVFGPMTAAALESAPYRKLEVLEAGPRVATRCVTMSDCSEADKGAIITLTLGRRRASQIFERLFKSKVHT